MPQIASQHPQPPEQPTFRIGAIARLTGIPVDTLRVWERRYQVVVPERSPTGSRLYRREAVARLALIKRLVDAGHAIGSVARLSLEQLQERLVLQARTPAPSGPAVGGVVRVAVLGEVLPLYLGGMGGMLEGVEPVLLERDPGRFRDTVGSSRADVLVLEYPGVHEETPTEVRALLDRSGARRALVVYGFGRDRVVRRLDTAEISAVRAPLDLAELRRWCLAAVGTTAGPAAEALPAMQDLPAPRRFDPEALARIATVSTTVRCECPHHLVQLVQMLSAFERYSAECESRDEQDAALHRFLHLTTAQARAMLEGALARVVEAEGLDLSPAGP
jgi:DNA-binding transcriptional MerR regulator